MLSRYKRPRLYKFVNQFPMTATEKLIHHKVSSRPKKIMPEDCWKKRDVTVA